MDNKKKILFIGAAAGALAVVSLSVGLTLAYLMDSDNKENTVKVGYGDQQISEKFSEPSIQTMENTTEKKVSVENKSSVPVFARVYMNFSDSSVADKAKVTYSNNGTDKKVTWAQFLLNMAADDNGTDWKYIPETGEGSDAELGGYFYYTKALEVEDDTATTENEKQTTNLIEQVYVDFRDPVGEGQPEDSNIDKIQPYELIVYSELVQTVETGSVTSNGQTVYGYDYNKPEGTPDEWRKAWKSYLAKDKKITPAS
jgi:hypothetical protein